MFKFLKQYFCRHKYEFSYFIFGPEKQKPTDVWNWKYSVWRCIKCGKEIRHTNIRVKQK